ncbi:uncharacterized protein LOC143283202 [Babylonia areolata]|uniref:uncharacterized protein LOC143283202 n=1 Tax=Babylonia areolata TaxID=304850 RepID=UPI003FD1D4DF
MQAVKRQPQTSSKRKTVLILSGAKGKALHLARLFKAEGYKVIMAEHRLNSFVGASFSKHVDAFFYLPIPKEDPQGYQTAILQIVKEHHPDLLVPIDPRTVQLDTQLFSQLPKTCLPLACEANVFKELDNKNTFMDSLHRHGIRAPRTQLVTSKQEAYDLLKGKSENYVFKPIDYDDVARTNIHPPENLKKLSKYLEESEISPSRPYVIQEKLEGPEMASVCLIVNNRLISHTVGFSGPVYQTQNHVDCEDIVQWAEDFVDRYPGRLTGWFTFDFMKSAADGKYYPLECNPRLGTSFMLFTAEDGTIPLLQQHLDSASNGGDLKARPTPSSLLSPKAQENGTSHSGPHRVMLPKRKQIFYLLNILWEMVSSPGNLAVWRRNLGILVRGHEAIFSVQDPLPFFALNFLQMPALIIHFLLHGKPWNIVDYNIGTLKMA